MDLLASSFLHYLAHYLAARAIWTALVHGGLLLVAAVAVLALVAAAVLFRWRAR